MKRPSSGKRNLVLKVWERHYGRLDTVERLHFTNKEDVLFLAGLDFAVFDEAIKKYGPELADIRRAASESLEDGQHRPQQGSSRTLTLPKDLVHRLLEHQGRRGDMGVVDFAEFWMERWRRIPQWSDEELALIAQACLIHGDNRTLLERAIRAESQIQRIVDYCSDAVSESEERRKAAARKAKKKTVRMRDGEEPLRSRGGHKAIGSTQNYEEDA